MNSLADGLPPEIAAALHPDWYRNESEYWIHREQLLSAYRGQWIAFADGAIIASDRNSVPVYRAAFKSLRHPFVIRAGYESEGIRIRRLAVPYDAAYTGPPLPVTTLEFRAMPGTIGRSYADVILDTGADASVLPLADCLQMGYSLQQGIAGYVTGVSGTSVHTLVFFGAVVIDGKEYDCQIQAELQGAERILGRDVLNSLDVLFRGPAGEAVFNP